MKDYETKTFVGYKISQGMSAVGHQCRNCMNAVEAENPVRKDTLFCVHVRALVKPNGTCKRIQERES